MAELRRMAAIVGLAVAALGIGSACGADRGPSSEARTRQSSAAPADLVRLVYTEADSDAGTIEIIADGNRRYRLTVVSGAEAGYYQVWDGKVMLIHTPDEGYQREEDPGGADEVTCLQRP